MRLLKSLTIVIVLSLLFSCNSDDPEAKTKNCMPLTLHLYTGDYFDSVAHAYDAQGKPEKLLYYKNAVITQTHYLEYNQQGQLVRVARENGYADILLNLELVYNSKGQVEQVIWRANTGGTAITTTTITHDTKGRLSTITDDIYQTRYEYTEDDNVSKIFYTPHGQNEILGRENHAFDNHQRFFADIPELVILNTYVFQYDPSKNNVISTTIYMPNVFTEISQPEEVSSDLKYDDNGMLISNYMPPQMLLYMQLESKLKKITYSCN